MSKRGATRIFDFGLPICDWEESAVGETGGADKCGKCDGPLWAGFCAYSGAVGAVAEDQCR